MPHPLAAAVEEFAGVREAMMIDTGEPSRDGVRLLFVVMQPGRTLDHALREAVHHRARMAVPQWHVPGAIYAVPEFPRTLAGMQHEVAVRQIFTGSTGNHEAVANPDALRYFVDLFNNL